MLRVVGPACRRVQAVLDDALTTGDLHLPPELAAHVSVCAHCAASADRVQMLLHRLRSVAAGLPLTGLPGAVDSVLRQTGHASGSGALPRRRLKPTWFLGQLATLAGLLALLAGLVAGVVGVLLHLLGGAGQMAWQPLAQALLSSPGASLLLEREMYVLMNWECIRYLWLLAAPGGPAAKAKPLLGTGENQETALPGAVSAFAGTGQREPDANEILSSYDTGDELARTPIRHGRGALLWRSWPSPWRPFRQISLWASSFGISSMS